MRPVDQWSAVLQHACGLGTEFCYLVTTGEALQWVLNQTHQSTAVLVNAQADALILIRG